MNEPQYSTLRKRYFWYCVAALLAIPTLLNLGNSLALSSLVYQWLPREPWTRSVYEAIVNSSFAVNEAFLMVVMMQLLVSWLWRPIEQTCWQRLGGLLIALWIGQSIQMLGYWLGAWVGGQEFYGSDWQDSLMMAALMPISMFFTFSVLWLWLLAASIVIPYRLVDLSAANHTLRYRVGRRWSIRGLMYLTTLIAAMIVGYQSLQRLSQWWFGMPPIDFSPWFLLIQIASMGITGLAVLWAATRYRTGGSLWIGCVVLVFVSALRAGVNWTFTQVIGPATVNSLLPQMITQAVLMVAVMFSLHLIIFHRWQYAGYQLRLSSLLMSAHC